MGELQIALLILGAMVIIAVIVYNRVQEARFRERAEDAFAPAQKETLAESSVPRANGGHARIEPQLQSADVPVHDPQEPRASVIVAPTPQEVETARAVVAPALVDPGEQTAAPADAADPVEPLLAPQPAAAPPAEEAEQDPLSYVARISAHEPLPAAAVEQMLRSMIGQTGRASVEGRSGSGAPWIALDAARVPTDLREVRAALQLVDRRGMVSQHDIAQFQSAVARCAGTARASSELPQAEPFLARARELDRFCAEVDVVVGMNVVAPRGRPFAGTRVRGLIEAAGFKSDQERFVYLDNANNVRFALENQDQGPLTADALRSAQVQGLTLLLDVPRQADGVATFNQMVQVGRQLAQSLGGTLVDDNGAPVTDAGLEQIRNQLRAIYATMEARGMPPGSSLAGRLFG